MSGRKVLFGPPNYRGRGDAQRIQQGQDRSWEMAKLGEVTSAGPRVGAAATVRRVTIPLYVHTCFLMNFFSLSFVSSLSHLLLKGKQGRRRQGTQAFRVRSTLISLRVGLCLQSA